MAQFCSFFSFLHCYFVFLACYLVHDQFPFFVALFVNLNRLISCIDPSENCNSGLILQHRLSPLPDDTLRHILSFLYYTKCCKNFSLFTSNLTTRVEVRGRQSIRQLENGTSSS
ncbi:unnamed protein product [Coffea canephora]|uniref:F-box domain-containing protein n=1 Tax=Coffea canephora TaxID=49390 RepID=A0A068UXY6_COFCA|nr:unnamed protein product [Coffea canephora]